MGNPNGNLWGSGAYKDNEKKEWKSHKGYYHLALVETFNKMTERDIEVRQLYAKGLIGEYLKVPMDMISFRKKSTKQTVASLDEVYYVKVGTTTVGKVSMRVQRAFREVVLAITFQEKSIREYSKTRQPYTSPVGYKKKGKAARRKSSRRAKRGTKKL